jgi:pimeloyl-ACP methyl ester carboxylesterase
MNNLKFSQIALGAFAIVIVIVAVLVYVRYRRDIQKAQTRLQHIDSEVVDTACGKIEYATYGDGFPVLVVHGIFGGHDQGLVLARGQIGKQFRSIVPSRFGYLGTPMPEDATPAEQADAFACLLDALEIDQAAILATSAGGTSAIQFALRHPDRCAALVLVSSNAPGEVEVGLPPKPVAKVIFRSDFIFWLLTTYFPSSMHSIMGVPGDFEMTPAFEEEMAGVMETLLPVHPRAEGALFDMYVSNPAINDGYPLGEISIPTLVIHAVDDPLANYENARAMADQIPDAKMLTVESGGHPLLGHEIRIMSEINAFLEQSVDSEQ